MGVSVRGQIASTLVVASASKRTCDTIRVDESMMIGRSTGVASSVGQFLQPHGTGSSETGSRGGWQQLGLADTSGSAATHPHPQAWSGRPATKSPITNKMETNCCIGHSRSDKVSSYCTVRLPKWTGSPQNGSVLNLCCYGRDFRSCLKLRKSATQNHMPIATRLPTAYDYQIPRDQTRIDGRDS